jgi:hypothetical protein
MVAVAVASAVGEGEAVGIEVRKVVGVDVTDAVAEVGDARVIIGVEIATVGVGRKVPQVVSSNASKATFTRHIHLFNLLGDT